MMETFLVVRSPSNPVCPGRRKPGVSALLSALCAWGVLVIAGCGGSQVKEPTPTSTSTSANSSKIKIGEKTKTKTNVSRPKLPELKFANMASEAGVNFRYYNGRDAQNHAILESLGGGIGFVDFDVDGRIDLFQPGGGDYGPKHANGSPPEIKGLDSAMFRGLGNWNFDRVSESLGAPLNTHFSHGCSANDYDGDGFPDICVSGWGGVQLLHNQGDGTFVDVTEKAGISTTLWSSGSGWGDFNKDGLLDLYLLDYVDWSFKNHPTCPGPQGNAREICSPRKFLGMPDVVYFNNGDGTFRDMSAEVGLRKDGKGLGVCIADLDLDGDVDIYVANDTVDNFLYLNKGDGTFVEKGILHGCAQNASGGPDGSMGVDVGDYNGDLLPDIWVSNFEEEAFALYRNEGKGRFAHISHATGITSLGTLLVGFGTAFVDVDQDGDEDFVVADGHVINFPKQAPVKQLPLVIINERRGKSAFYQRVIFPESSYFGSGHRGRGLAVADIDSDGDLDFAFSHNDNEPTALVRNDNDFGSSWLRVHLTGVKSNRDAIGAWMVLRTSTGNQLRLIKGGGSYISQNEMTATWGIAKGTKVNSLVIHWPSGVEQEIKDIKLNTQHSIVEPTAGESDKVASNQ